MVVRPERTSILILAVLGLAPSAWAAGDIVPHHAEYTVVLTPATDRPSPSGSGRVVQQIRESCEGRSFRREARLWLDRGDGRVVTRVVTLDHWESLDGRQMRFSIMVRMGDRIVRHLEGAARLPGNGKPGTARFTMPAPKTVTLPPDTLFLFSFMRRHSELPWAEDERRTFRVFDGGSGDGQPMRVVVRAVAKSGVAAGIPEGDRALLDKTPRVFEFLHYSSSGADLTPIYSAVIAVQRNGVARDFTVESGGVRFTYTLKRIKALPKAVCRGARNGFAPRIK